MSATSRIKEDITYSQRPKPLDFVKAGVQPNGLKIEVYQNIRLLSHSRRRRTNRSETISPADHSRDEHQQVRVYLCKSVGQPPYCIGKYVKKQISSRTNCGAVRIYGSKASRWTFAGASRVSCWVVCGKRSLTEFLNKPCSSDLLR